MPAVIWIIKNWLLVAGGIVAAMVVATWLYVGHLRARVADLDARLATVQAVNTANLDELDKLKAAHAATLKAIKANTLAAASRTRAVAAIKQDIRDAKIPEGACTTVGPRLRAALDGLRKHRAAGTHPGGAGDTPRRPVDLRPRSGLAGDE